MSRLKATRALIGVFATALALAVAASLVPDSAYLRFQLREHTDQAEAKWIYERIHFYRTPIDVAIVGASNAQLGLSSTRLNEDLAARGLPLNVENFAMPFGGRNLNYVIVKELFSAGRIPKLLIVGVAARPAYFGNPGFRYLAARKDILDAIYPINLNYLSDLKYLPFRQIKLAAMDLLPRMFDAASTFELESSPLRRFDPAIDDRPGWRALMDRDRSLPEALLAGLPAQKRRDQPILPKTLVNFEFGDETFYMPKIVALAHRHGTKVAFVYIPDYQGPERSLMQNFYLQFGPVFSADFVRTHQKLYYDLVHLNRKGALTVSDWLTKYILTMLEDVRPRPDN